MSHCSEFKAEGGRNPQSCSQLVRSAGGPEHVSGVWCEGSLMEDYVLSL